MKHQRDIFPSDGVIKEKEKIIEWMYVSGRHSLDELSQYIFIKLEGYQAPEIIDSNMTNKYSEKTKGVTLDKFRELEPEQEVASIGMRILVARYGETNSIERVRLGDVVKLENMTLRIKKTMDIKKNDWTQIEIVGGLT